MMVLRNSSGILESNSIDMSFIVSFAVARFTQFVRDELNEDVGAIGAFSSGIAIGTMSGNT